MPKKAKKVILTVAQQLEETRRKLTVYSDAIVAEPDRLKRAALKVSRARVRARLERLRWLRMQEQADAGRAAWAKVQAAVGLTS